MRLYRLLRCYIRHSGKVVPFAFKLQAQLNISSCLWWNTNLYKYAGLNWWAIYQISLLILRHLCWASFLEYLAPFNMLNWQLTISSSTLNIFKNVCLNSNRNMPVAALPVTQQMTEMSISREDKVTTPKTEVSEPGMLFIWFFNLFSAHPPLPLHLQISTLSCEGWKCQEFNEFKR